MSTRGRIGVLRPDGRVESIYNHFDSYKEGLGAALKNRFNNPKIIDELIALGDRRGLYDDDDYDFRDPKNYYSDKKDKYPSRFDNDEDSFWDNDDDWDIDYKYLYVPDNEGGAWFVNGKRTPFAKFKNPADLANSLTPQPLTIQNPQAAITGGEGKIVKK